MNRSEAVEADGYFSIWIDDRWYPQPARELLHLGTRSQVVLHVDLAKGDIAFAEVSHRGGAVGATGFRVDAYLSHDVTSQEVPVPLVLDGWRMNVISTPSAPKPVAAYSQAIEANGFIFCAGQLGIDPNSGKLADGLAAQAEQAFKNLSAVLEAAGSGFTRVVKVSIYMRELANFATVNEIYARFVGEHRPARTTTGASDLPAGALIEVDAIAAL